MSLSLVFHCKCLFIDGFFPILFRLFFMQKKLIGYVLNYSKRNLRILWSSRLKSAMKLGISFRILPTPFRICKCADQLSVKLGPSILFHGTWKTVILVHGMYFSVTLKALFRYHIFSFSVNHLNLKIQCIFLGLSFSNTFDGSLPFWIGILMTNLPCRLALFMN